MERRLLQRIALIGGALAVVGGAVLVLRNPDSGSGHSDETAPLPTQQTSVAAFADASVVVPDRGPRPAPPPRLNIRAADHRLLVGWGPRYTGVPEPDGVVGYEVRWGEGVRFTHTRLVAQPVVQLDGLQNDLQHTIVVRSVDSFGQRSNATRGTGTPEPGPADLTPYTLVDRFTGDDVPDPARWRLVGIGNCTKAARGAGEDTYRMVITGQCGNSDESVALRSRTPLRLRDPGTAPAGELGRFVVQTDRPGQSGDLMLDLVPGPADLIGRPPNEDPPPAEPGRATVDDSLPPGTIRVRISGRPKENTVRVLVGPGTTLLGRPVAVQPVPPPEIWVSARWEVVLRTDGVRVERDGVVVGGGDAVPSFTEATPLIGLTGGAVGLHGAFDLIGLSGAATVTPPVLPGPQVDFDRAVTPAGPARTAADGIPLAGVRSGQLRITLVPQQDRPDGQFIVDVGGQQIPARPAVPGQPVRQGVRLPVVADVPPQALTLRRDAIGIPIAVHTTAAEDGLPTQVLTAELELAGGWPQAASASRTPNPPLPRIAPTLATPVVVLLDAAGVAVPAQQDVPRGRILLEVAMDAAVAQRAGGEVAGLAGVEVRLDGRQLAGIPAATDGPGIGGDWRIALNTAELPAGGHTVQVTAVGADPNTAFAVSYLSFVLR